eukprot:2230620-Amphidinium_carterae.2
MSFEVDGDDVVDENEHTSEHGAGTKTMLGSGTASSGGELPETILKRGRGRPAKKKGEDGDTAKDTKKPAGKKRTCGACKKPAEPNCSWCVDDKRAMDRIRFSCRQQGFDAQKWLKDLQSPGEKAVAEALQQYWSQVGGRSKYVPGVSKFNLTQMRESLQAESALNVTTRGTMMWRKQIIEWKVTTPGGRFSEEESTAKWEELVTRHMAGDKELETDMDGHRADQPIRFRIATDKFVDYTSRLALQKTLEQTKREKADETNLAKVRREVISNHDAACGATGSELKMLGSQLASASNEAFLPMAGERSFNTSALMSIVPAEDGDDDENDDEEEEDNNDDDLEVQLRTAGQDKTQS